MYVQPTTGTVHTTASCSVARRRTRYGTVAVTDPQAQAEVREALADGRYAACGRC